MRKAVTKKKLRIGLVGEDPNDTNAVKNLLSKRYPYHTYQTVTKNMSGTAMLLSPKGIKTTRFNIEQEKYDRVIVIRDLDAIKSNNKRISDYQKWFENYCKEVGVGAAGRFMLNIFELEALILADIDAFHKEYGTNWRFTADPEMKVNPKEFLKQKTEKTGKKYHENHCPELFGKLDYDKLLNKCSFFKKFDTDFKAETK